MQFIDLKAQYKAYRAEIDSAMARVLEHGHFIMGPEIADLEGKLAAYVGVKHCLTVSSGTQSREISLRARCIGPGTRNGSIYVDIDKRGRLPRWRHASLCGYRSANVLHGRLETGISYYLAH